MKVKATHHIALCTPNFAAMGQFYGETLGFSEDRRWADAGILFYKIGNTEIELLDRPASTANTQPTGGWDHLALHVESVDEAYQELVEKGVKIKTEPKNFQDVRIAFFFDPDGNAIELVEDPRVE